MTRLNPEACRFRPAANVHARRLGNELVLLDFANGEYFSLDETGTVVWERCVDGATISEIAECLVARYNVQMLDALHDVSALARELLERGLLVTD